MFRAESAMAQWLKSAVPAAHWQRIECGAMGPGVPDLNACFKGRETWLELKRVKGRYLPVSAIRLSQVAWLTARARAGGACFLLVGRDTGQLHAIHGKDLPRAIAEAVDGRIDLRAWPNARDHIRLFLSCNWDRYKARYGPTD